MVKLFHSKSTDNALKTHKRLCGNHDYCHIAIPEEDHHGEKLLKAPFAFFADLECLLIKYKSCQNNPENSYTDRKANHEHSGYSLSLIRSFDATKNRHYFYGGKDWNRND